MNVSGNFLLDNCSDVHLLYPQVAVSQRAQLALQATSSYFLLLLHQLIINSLIIPNVQRGQLYCLQYLREFLKKVSLCWKGFMGKAPGAIMTGINSFTAGTEHRGTEFHCREEPAEADRSRSKGPDGLSTLDIAPRLCHDSHNMLVGSFKMNCSFLSPGPSFQFLNHKTADTTPLSLRKKLTVNYLAASCPETYFVCLLQV